MVHRCVIKAVAMWLHILVVSLLVCVCVCVFFTVRSSFNVNFNIVFKTFNCAFVGE
jgi:hypothetical protein